MEAGETHMCCESARVRLISCRWAVLRTLFPCASQSRRARAFVAAGGFPPRALCSRPAGGGGTCCAALGSVLPALTAVLYETCAQRGCSTQGAEGLALGPRGCFRELLHHATGARGERQGLLRVPHYNLLPIFVYHCVSALSMFFEVSPLGRCKLTLT